MRRRVSAARVWCTSCTRSLPNSDAIDASEVPAAALSIHGNGLVGWVSRGHVLAASLRARSTSFAKPQTVSGTRFASDVVLGFGPNGRAVAAWSQGTLAPEVVGAVYRP